MAYITFTHVDAVTGVPVTQAPARNGPTLPAGADFGFALESLYPTSAPTLYGTTTGRTDRPGILSVVTEADYDAAYRNEMAARLDKARANALAALADVRWRAEEGGVTLPNGTILPTDRTTQAKITAAFVKADKDPAYVVSDWKMAPGVFSSLDAVAIRTIADAIEAHVQACFSHEAKLSARIVAADTVEDVHAIDLVAGWP